MKFIQTKTWKYIVSLVDDNVRLKILDENILGGVMSETHKELPFSTIRDYIKNKLHFLLLSFLEAVVDGASKNRSDKYDLFI